MMNYQCLLFDLDGTLVDSRVDLINSVNLMLAGIDRPQLPDSEVLNFVGEGARLLVERALRATQLLDPKSVEIDEALKAFQGIYSKHLLDRTRAYPEVEETLARFSHLPMAVVTNKPYEFTVTILKGIGLLKFFKVIFGGDSLPRRKPAPLMLLEAARSCETEPSMCLMVGDSRIDVVAGKAAGMKTCGFISGFRGRDELVEAGADFIIERFSQLSVLVEG